MYNASVAESVQSGRIIIFLHSLPHHYTDKAVKPREDRVSCLSSRLVTAAAKSRQLCPTLCDPIDGSPPGSTIPGILQARTLEWVAISFSNACKWKVKVKSLSCVRQLCPTLSDPRDGSPPDSSIHGIFQARVLEWGAIAFSARLVKEATKQWEVVSVYFELWNPCWGKSVYRGTRNDEEKSWAALIEEVSGQESHVMCVPPKAGPWGSLWIRGSTLER